jgi:hypothetical protein
VNGKRNYGTYGISGNYGKKRIFSVNSVCSVVSLLCFNVVWFDLVPADKGLWDPFRQALYAQRQGVEIVVPARKNMTETQPRPLLRACRRWRKIVETVGSQLTQRFAVTRIRVRDLWHYNIG